MLKFHRVGFKHDYFLFTLVLKIIFFVVFFNSSILKLPNADFISKSQNAIYEIVDIAKHVLSFLKGMSPSMIYDTRKYYPKQWEKVESRHFSFLRNKLAGKLLIKLFRHFLKFDTLIAT